MPPSQWWLPCPSPPLNTAAPLRHFFLCLPSPVLCFSIALITTWSLSHFSYHLSLPWKHILHKKRVCGCIFTAVAWLLEQCWHFVDTQSRLLLEQIHIFEAKPGDWMLSWDHWKPSKPCTWAGARRMCLFVDFAEGCLASLVWNRGQVRGWENTATNWDLNKWKKSSGHG